MLYCALYCVICIQGIISPHLSSTGSDADFAPYIPHYTSSSHIPLFVFSPSPCTMSSPSSPSLSSPSPSPSQVTWKSKLKAAFPDPNNYSSFMGNFSTATGMVTLLMMLAGRVVFKKFGWGVAAMITPITLLTTGQLLVVLSSHLLYCVVLCCIVLCCIVHYVSIERAAGNEM